MTLSQWLSCEIEVIRTMASKMVEEFDKCWLVTHGVIRVAVVLDPRYKMSVLEFYFKKHYRDCMKGFKKGVGKFEDLRRSLKNNFEIGRASCRERVCLYV